MKIIAVILFGLILSASVLAQEAITETQKIDAFGPPIKCCDFGARVEYMAITQRANPGLILRRHRLTQAGRLRFPRLVQLEQYGRRSFLGLQPIF